MAYSSALKRNNVKVTGEGDQALVLVHGFGCDYKVWKYLTPHFTARFRVVTLDLTGSGLSDISAYDFHRHATLDGHAQDVIEVCRELNLSQISFVGHSVASMIGVLMANAEPQLVSRMVMLCPSPCYLNDGDYRGGFESADVDGLLDFLDANFLEWSTKMAPVFMGVQSKPELAAALTENFCRNDPDIARHFGRVTFLGDHRRDVSECSTPSLILQTSDDFVAPTCVGEWMHGAMYGSTLKVLRATGHCPHLSSPEETLAALRGYLSDTAHAAKRI